MAYFYFDFRDVDKQNITTGFCLLVNSLLGPIHVVTYCTLLSLFRTLSWSTET
jgi:hypothetical protein